MIWQKIVSNLVRWAGTASEILPARRTEPVAYLSRAVTTVNFSADGINAAGDRIAPVAGELLFRPEFGGTSRPATIL